MYSGKGYGTRMFIVAYGGVCGHEEGLGDFKEGCGGVCVTSKPSFSASESRSRGRVLRSQFTQERETQIARGVGSVQGGIYGDNQTLEKALQSLRSLSC
jgi:hypothetical protein